MDDKEDKRRQRAYRIWEDEGRPEGRDLDHWQRAEEQHEMTEEEATLSSHAEGGRQKPPTAKQGKKMSADVSRPARG